MSVPSTIVRPTFAAVKITVRSSVPPEDLVLQHGRVVVEADPDALALDQLGQPVLLERERDELVERVAEDRRDHDDDRQDQQVRNRRRAARGRSDAVAAETGGQWPRRRPSSRLDPTGSG